MMLDPLQNILDCADVIVNKARPQFTSTDPDVLWLAQIGELDHVTEIHATIQAERRKASQAMTIEEAILKSRDGYAIARSHGRELVAYEKCGGIRIIKCVTDPTVVRKLRPSDHSLNWRPLNPQFARR